MKAIFIDTNSVNENGTLCINEFIIKNMELQKNEKVVAYQDEDSWEAEIVFDANNWGVVLHSNTKEISKERQEGHDEGFWWGYYLQSIRLIQILQDLNYSSTEIEKIKERLGIK